MIDLRYDLRDAYEGGFIEHPQKEMEKLGIKYIDAEPQPIGDSWLFIECTNLPDELPSFLKEIPKY